MVVIEVVGGLNIEALNGEGRRMESGNQVMALLYTQITPN